MATPVQQRAVQQLGGKGASKGDFYRESSKQKDVRSMNIDAAKSVADAVRTSLGPRGMDKMILTPEGEVIITNDGATILNKLTVMQPAAKMLVELSKSQDIVAGDGTTTVAVICGSLLKRCLDLMAKGVHPTQISDAFQVACQESCKILESIATEVNLDDREKLIEAASTSLSSKVVSNYSQLLSPMAVDCVLQVVDRSKPEMLDLNDIRVHTILGATVDDSYQLQGMVLNQKASKMSGSPTRMQDAKIALLQFQISPPKTDIENNIVISDYTQMDRVLKEERNYILQMVKKIKASGANVLLIQKSILRDAVTDLSLHYLAKAKIMVVTDIERDEVEYIAKTLNLLPIAHIDHMRPQKLGHAKLVEEVDMGSQRIVQLTGIENLGKTATVVLRGSNKLVLEEAERSLHDALCVTRCLAQKPFLIPGGAAPEMDISLRLSEWSKGLEGGSAYAVREFAEALEVIPYTLAENAGLNPIAIVSQLRKLHADGKHSVGINVRKGAVGDMIEAKVIQPLQVTRSAIQLASECVRLILKIDDIVLCR